MSLLLPTLIANMLNLPEIAEVKLTRTRRKRRSEEQIKTDSLLIMEGVAGMTASELAGIDGQDLQKANERLESWKAEGLVINEGLHWRLKCNSTIT